MTRCPDVPSAGSFKTRPLRSQIRLHLGAAKSRLDISTTQPLIFRLFNELKTKEDILAHLFNKYTLLVYTWLTLITLCFYNNSTGRFLTETLTSHANKHSSPHPYIVFSVTLINYRLIPINASLAGEVKWIVTIIIVTIPRGLCSGGKENFTGALQKEKDCSPLTKT